MILTALLSVKNRSRARNGCVLFTEKDKKREKECESRQETKRNLPPPPVPLRPKLRLFDPALFTGAANP